MCFQATASRWSRFRNRENFCFEQGIQGRYQRNFSRRTGRTTEVQRARQKRMAHRSACCCCGLIHHRDRDSQYVSINYTERLAQVGIDPSARPVAIFRSRWQEPRSEREIRLGRPVAQAVDHDAELALYRCRAQAALPTANSSTALQSGATAGLEYCPVESIDLTGRAIDNGEARIDSGAGGQTRIPAFRFLRCRRQLSHAGHRHRRSGRGHHPCPTLLATAMIWPC